MFGIKSPEEMRALLPFDDKTAVTYNLFYRILDDPEAFAVISDEGTCVAAQNINNSMWLWMDERCSDDQIRQYCKELVEVLKTRSIPSVIGMTRSVEPFSGLYATKHDLKLVPGMGMIAYYCPQAIPHSNTSWRVYCAGESDIDIIAEFSAGFTRDAFNKPAEKGDYIKTAERLINSGNLYVLHNGEAVVSMANIAHRTKEYGRINLVYTPRELRKKGYASHIVTALSEQLLTEGITPMLYTDDTNATSNKVYQDCGFIETGRLASITFTEKQ